MKAKKIYTLTVLNITIAFFAIVTLCGCGNYSNSCVNSSQQAQKVLPAKLLTPTPHKALLALLAACTIQHDGSAQDIIEKTQQAWLRKPNVERWHVHEPEKISHAAVLRYFEELGMVKEITPLCKDYDYALILGATVGSVRDRLAYLTRLWDQGIRCKTIVLLGSDRPLSASVESDASLKNIPQRGLPTRKNWLAPVPLPTTESTMMRMIFEQVEMPDEMQKCQLVVVSSPQSTKPDGTVRRATTGDTIIDWRKMNPQPGRCLFISNQPYVGYQHSVVRSLLPQNFMVETVGAGVRDPLSLDINLCLDALARWLYQENGQKRLVR